MTQQTRQKRTESLAYRFRRQQEFSLTSSPLAACLCGLCAQALESYQLGPREMAPSMASCLLEVSEGVSAFAVPMLFLAALHREILRHNPAFAALAVYYPTVGGTRPPAARELAPLLQEIVLSQRSLLAHFIQSRTVQTNETARGVCWLLPALYVPWPAVAVIDLGCSAGLNLLADQYRYCFLREDATSPELTVGYGKQPPFSLHVRGPFAPPLHLTLPQIGARLGADLHPFPLVNRDDEITLSSFVWGDQCQRLARLEQGMAALRYMQQSPVPVHLFSVDIPQDLPAFLEQRVTSLCREMPVILYNTYLRPYLADKGIELERAVAQWAVRQMHPVLWLQWEVSPSGQDGRQPPYLGWCAWTASLWIEGVYHSWRLAWVHPHGTEVCWLPEMAEWSAFWESQ